ncbi:MAG: hypothetical protein IPK50_15195 [Fibrobacterota bacterium]|nr:hypothetical protein [Fibrobacterota bacterium]QQS03638.1 MAG: hypothetical protein IPK50_15195 [Fibrobacterota bacterium]
MKKFPAIVLIGSALALIGCGSSNAGKSTTPDWYLNQPSGGGLYGVGSQESRSLDLAKEQADHGACVEISKALAQKMEGLTKRYIGQEGAVKSNETKEALSAASRSVVNINMIGCINKKREVVELPGGAFRVYSLQFLDPAGAVATTKAAREAQQALAQSKETFDELDKLLERDLKGGVSN